MTKYYNIHIFKKRRSLLRRKQTKAEILIWNKLRNKQFLWLKRRRQYSVWPYILDFYCPSVKFAIEVDWSVHVWNEEYDDERTWFLNSFWIQVLRYTNDDVYENIDAVFKDLLKYIQPHLASP